MTTAVDAEKIKEEKEEKENIKTQQAGRGLRGLARGGGAVVDGDDKRNKAVLGCLMRLLSNGKEDELGKNKFWKSLYFERKN
jgi:hypothetical protein